MPELGSFRTSLAAQDEGGVHVIVDASDKLTAWNGLRHKLSFAPDVCAHMGGGVSVAALEGGRVVDVNDAL